jgi:hypothetical protein
MLNRFFVEERRYNIEVLRTLIMRYPFILSKKEDEIKDYFAIL